MADRDAGGIGPVNQIILNHLTSIPEVGRPPSGDLNTGDVRRAFNLSSKALAELRPQVKAFMTLLNLYRRNPTDDPEFKFLERRSSFQKRYGYCLGFAAATQAAADPVVYADTIDTTALNFGDTVFVQMGTDYKNSGNVVNTFDYTASRTQNIKVGDTYTRPIFFTTNAIIRIPLATAAATDPDAAKVEAVLLGKIVNVNQYTTDVSEAETVELELEIVNTIPALASYYVSVASANIRAVDLSDKKPWVLDKVRTYVNGNAYGMGSAFKDTWMDQPFSFASGQTQIIKTILKMDNTTRASVLKYEPNEFVRIWGEKLIEHDLDKEKAGIFSHLAETVDDEGNRVLLTEGAENFIQSYGHIFELDYSAASMDYFLDTLEVMKHPYYGYSGRMVYFADTEMYNWLRMLTGYMQENVTAHAQYRFSFTDIKKVAGLEIPIIWTPAGEIAVVRSLALDQSNIAMMGIDMSMVEYKPLVGNSLNRDTGVYIGVQSLLNTGRDAQVDLIQTEFGMAWKNPEAHCLYLKKTA